MLEASIENVMAKSGMDRDAALDFFRSQNPSGELVQPADVAEAVWSLLTEGANGALLELDGGPTPHLRT